jgi:hypothetical protein
MLKGDASSLANLTFPEAFCESGLRAALDIAFLPMGFNGYSVVAFTDGDRYCPAHNPK